MVNFKKLYGGNELGANILQQKLGEKNTNQAI